jgi:hypothetical protein
MTVAKSRALYAGKYGRCFMLPGFCISDTGSCYLFKKVSGFVRKLKKVWNSYEAEKILELRLDASNQIFLYLMK